MNLFRYFFVFILFITILPSTSFTQPPPTLDINETDNSDDTLSYFFDLRERESFVQLTNTSGSNITVHVQIFNVDMDCNENNFFDTYTPNDTHVYNLRDVVSNNGNPAGFVLPVNAYGMVVISVVDGVGGPILQDEDVLIGNFRILDVNGYEYRTNAQSEEDFQGSTQESIATFNFNTNSGINLSDVIGISYRDDVIEGEIVAADLTDTYTGFDIDIFNLDEVPFSCRNVIFACTDQDNPRLEELLEQASNDGVNASVASFEYGINDAIQHSKGAELLCPGNNINNGFVRLTYNNNSPRGDFAGYIGLNNGNGRGSIDSFWISSGIIQQPPPG